MSLKKNQQKRPPQWWVRILSSVVFFIGGIFMIFWAQGFRFDFSQGDIVATGVFSLSSSPSSSHIFLSNHQADTAPSVFLGLPAGNLSFCLTQNSFQSLCEDVRIHAGRVQEFLDILLLPSVPRFTAYGPVADILWDAHGRGFVRLLPHLATVQVVDAGKKRFIEDPFPQEVVLSPSGEMFLSDGTRKTVFFSSPSILTEQSLWNESFVYFKGNRLFLRNTKESYSQLLTSFSEPISQIFFVPHSHSFFIELPSHILFYAFPAASPRLFSRKDRGASVRFFATQGELFWEKEGVLIGFSLPKE